MKLRYIVLVLSVAIMLLGFLFSFGVYNEKIECEKKIHYTPQSKTGYYSRDYYTVFSNSLNARDVILDAMRMFETRADAMRYCLLTN